MTDPDPDAAPRDPGARSAKALLGDLVEQVTELAQKELQLLRAELSEKLEQVGVAVGLIVAGLVFAITAINVLASALVGALAAAGVPASWAAVIVGAAIALLAFLLVRLGAQRLKLANLKPERTLRSISRSAKEIKERIR